jgi:alpha-tubulin suppressor-like RCC1 family protein
LFAPQHALGGSAPVITTGVTNRATMIYSNVTISIVATGAPPMFYQWQKNGTNLANVGNVSGATSTNLTITHPLLADSGQYSVTVTNASGSALSSGTLTVVPIYSWGDGPVTPPPAATNVIGIGAGGQVIYGDFAVRADGSVLGWGANVYGIMDIPRDVTNVVSLLSGNEQVIAIRGDGTVATWGYGGTNVSADATNVVAAALQNYSGCIALRQDGTIATWGGASVPPATATNIIAIGAGSWGSCLAVRQDGTVIGWGDNSYGQSAPPPEATNVFAVACGDRHSLALRTDGSVVVFGLKAAETTPPADFTNMVAVAAGQEFSVGIRKDGTAEGFGSLAAVPPYVTNCVAIAARYYHAVVMVPDPSVHAAPRLIQQPLGATVRTNQTLLLLSQVVGTFPFAFQWHFNGSPLADQTNRFLQISSVQTAQGGQYKVVVTNNYGSVTSAPAIVWTMPAIVAPPAATVVFNSNALFNVTAAGTAPLSYQWYFNGDPLADGGRFAATAAAHMTIGNFQPADLGSYTVVVSNFAGSITSSVAAITVLNPLFASQPQSQSALGGATVNFSVTATGQQPLSYQWRLNGTNLPSATDNPLVLTNVLVSQSGAYSVMVSNDYGAIVSGDAMLMVSPFTIFPQPHNLSLLGGSTASLSVALTGQSPFSYQWLYNGTNLPGATNNPLTIPDVHVNQSGNYSVLVSNAYGTVLSSNAVVNVAPLAITSQPTNRIAWINGSAAFRVSVNGQSPFAYDWLLNGVSISGASTNALTLTNLQPAQFGTYTVVISNAYGTLSSSNAALLLSQVAVWGGFLGETNLTPGLTNLIAISACPASANSEDCQALRADGSAMTWPTNLSNFQSYGMSNLIALAAGAPGYALRATGVVVRLYPEGGLLVSGARDIAALAVYNSLLMLGSTGAVSALSGSSGNSAIPSGALSNVVAIAQGSVHSLALRADGSVLAWGSNSSGQTNVPAGLGNIVAIAAGNAHSLALREDGTVIGWGLNSAGQVTIPVGLSNVVSIAAGASHSLALRADGTVIAWGLNTTGQTNVPASLANVIAISAGQTFSMALIGNGPPVSQAPLTNASFATNTFSAMLPTQCGKVYGLEYKNALSDSNWTRLPLVPGNGSAVLLTDPTATNSQRIYRVRRW